MSARSFFQYARYYDLLNRDKDYAAEVGFVDGLLREAGARPGSLLDVGCGTGAHAREFAARGWSVTGVDLSEQMIGLARAKSAPETGIQYATGAAAEFSLPGRFTAVVSLFHVVSYQAAPGEAARMFANVRRHLAPGGVFVFDFWHGPGVRADPPRVRVRRAEDDGIRVTRTARPVHRVEEQIVEVNYEVQIEDRRTGATERINEVHRMRYFFLTEIEAGLRAAGMVIEKTGAGLTPRALSPDAWYGLVVARAGAA